MKLFTFSRKTELLIVVAFLILITPSCVKDNFELNKLEKTSWNPDVAIPLVYSSLTIQNLLQNNSTGQIIVGDSNLCTLVYNNTLLSITADSLIKLPTQQFPSYSVSLTSQEVNALGSSNSITESYSQTVSFNPGTNGTQIDTVIFNGGSFDMALNSNFANSGQIIISIPAAKKNGVSFSETIPFTYSGTVPVIVSANDSLAGYLLDMTMGGTTNNSFVVNYTVTLNSSGTPATTNESLTISGSLDNLHFNKIFGDIGQLSLFPSSALDTIAVSIFSKYTGSGTFTIVDPTLKVTISNSLGVPIKASFPVLETLNPPTSVSPITGVPNPLPIPVPNFSQIGQVLTNSFTLTHKNSNVAIVSNNHPKYFAYSATAITNPNGPTDNFVIDTSHIKINTEVDLPLYGTASNFALIDTVKFSPGQYLTSNVESALFKISTSNGFPIDVNMQVYFTDSLYNKLDSLVIPNQLILASGTLNSSGMVVAPAQSNYTAAFTKTKLANLKTAKFVLVKAVESTTNGGNTNVKIYSTYRLNLNIGMQVQLQTKL